MTAADITQEIQGIFETVFRRRDIVVRPDLTAADVPGWDSFRYVSLIMAIEKRFSIEFSDQDIDELENVGDLIDAIARRIETV
jgi:acyl carrier protein